MTIPLLALAIEIVDQVLAEPTCGRERENPPPPGVAYLPCRLPRDHRGPHCFEAVPAGKEIAR